MRITVSLVTLMALIILNTPTLTTAITKTALTSAPTSDCTIGFTTSNLNWDDTQLRVWMSSTLTSSLVTMGGLCTVTFTKPTYFTLNASQAQVTLDGVRIPSGDKLSLKGTSLMLVFISGNNLNGFDLFVKIFNAFLPLAARNSAPPAIKFDVVNASCIINGSTQNLFWTPDQVVFPSDQMLQSIKTAGGTCTVTFKSNTQFLYDSIAGTITVDGRQTNFGNNVQAVGKEFKSVYGPNIPSAGFALRSTS